MDTIVVNSGNSKTSNPGNSITSDPHRLLLNLLDKNKLKEKW